jgi:rubrerythrin
MLTGVAFGSLSLMDALDLAVMMEEEARERYEVFTKLVGGRYAGDASDMFRLMASYEEKHGAQIAARRRQLFGDAPPRLDRDAIFQAEAPDMTAPRVFMSPRQALEVAIESEQKAFDFFDEALPHIVDRDVRALFEELRGEEAQHQKFLKERLAKLPPGPDIEEDEADEPGSDPGN